MVECNLCKEEYSETHIEFHLVGVHGVDGPKEVYSSSEFASETFSLSTVSKVYYYHKGVLGISSELFA